MPFAANERTFLGWLSMAVTIGSVSAALVGFTASEEKGDSLCQASDILALPIFGPIHAVGLYFYSHAADPCNHPLFMNPKHCAHSIIDPLSQTGLLGWCR